MQGICRFSFRLPLISRLLSSTSKNVKAKNGFNCLYSTAGYCSLTPIRHNPSKKILCSRWSNQISSYSTSNVDEDLTKFLEQEIRAEEGMTETKTIPSKIDDFQVKLDGSEVTLHKDLPNESIVITCSINNSLVNEEDESIEEDNNVPSLRCEPEFQIDIKRGDLVVGFNCAFTSRDAVEDELDDDLFCIEEISVFSGEWNEKTYTVPAKIIDSELYALLMHLLYDRGIKNEFVMKMVDLCTVYEKNSYISLLRALKKFVSS